MTRIGIDVGSTFTKYCVMKDRKIIDLFSKKTPIRQYAYFENEVENLKRKYQDSSIVSCGYGRENVSAVRRVNELTALAVGSYYMLGADSVILDIGGQDTKIIEQKNGKLTQFFTNDKCAAGSGMFLISILNMLGMEFKDINLIESGQPKINLSSICAVFAQSEIVELIAKNKKEKEIIEAVIWQILVKAKALLLKINAKDLVLSGGFCQIRGLSQFAERVFDRKCIVAKNGDYLSAIGCALIE